MSSVEVHANKENELDERVQNKLPARKAKPGSRRGFGKFLDNAMTEIREESDYKLAMKYQSQESNGYITQERMYKQDYSYADELSKKELEGRLGTQACSKADEKSTPVKPRAADDGNVAECKTPAGFLNYEDDEKACTPFQKGMEQEEDRYHKEDADIANRLHIAEQKEYHRIRIGELFDADYAKHLADDETHDSKACYINYVNKKWDNVESYLDDVAGGICISLLLPELDTYNVSIFENHSIQVDGYRKTHEGDDAQKAPEEYKADYSFEGATRGISDDMVEHEYITASGILFIFVERLRLRGPSSQCYVSPSKQQNNIVCEMEKPKLVNEKVEQNHFVSKNQTSLKGVSQNSFMLRVKKSTLGRMFSFQGK